MRLTGDKTKYAWLETASKRQANRKKLSEAELYGAQHELMWEAFRAADFQPVGQSEIKQAKARLADMVTAAQSLAREIREVDIDAQIYGLWGSYQGRRHDDVPLSSIVTELDGLADFFRWAETHYKPQGPVLPVGQPKDREALKTTVIRKIAETCEKHFETPLLGTVATLANESLNRNDITRASVQGCIGRRKDRADHQCGRAPCPGDDGASHGLEGRPDRKLHGRGAGSVD